MSAEVIKCDRVRPVTCQQKIWALLVSRSSGQCVIARPDPTIRYYPLLSVLEMTWAQAAGHRVHFNVDCYQPHAGSSTHKDSGFAYVPYSSFTRTF